MRSLLPMAAILAAPLLIAAQPVKPDPNLYLENIHGARALATVKRWNTRSLDALEALPGFKSYQQRALQLLQNDHQLSTPDQVVGDHVLNLWRDKANPRGLWRMTTLESFASGKPQWHTLINIDALGKQEGKSWVWKGADCNSPDHDLCMVSLSNGGGDAVIQREFNLNTGTFVTGGFTLPTAKSETSWAGNDALYVGTDFGKGSMTNSGYPRIVKLWRRGTPLSSAKTIATGKMTDVAVDVRVLTEGAKRYPILDQATDFFHSKRNLIAPDGHLIPLPLPSDAKIDDVLDGQLIATLVSDWKGLTAGSVVSYPMADALAGKQPRVSLVFAPNRHQAVEQVMASRSVLWVKLLDDVSGRLVALTHQGDGHWQAHPMTLPDKATIHLNSVSHESNLAFATVEGFLNPPTLYAARPDTTPVKLETGPTRFNASDMVVEQHFATSKDGTKIPYFEVRKKGVTGPRPVLLHAYGGFADAQTPSYLVTEPYRSGPAALFWVQEGNVYVLANIRGGGEYGPRWHKGAMREKHQNAFDDQFAVAQDLVKRGVTKKGDVAISGRSNGGLLVGAGMEQHPQMYGAVVMGSPLLDMKRYSHLLAGASWIGEYGDPDKPSDWAFISKYSPYQNLKRGVHYPVPFIYTSTEDDRVDPGHARKFAARLEQYGDKFYYYENPEGGHAAGADRVEDAKRAALVTVYLNKELDPDGAGK
ncbi:prolyl oligopeptidase family protein [Stakelama sediminis]|uniref:Prolyl oligopeptidase n=1 Tax=Stakelama sediminis TaxID=463200 RepID=A0A840YWV5_9SPHN|nr:prolyl oligopeptidase family serine peptidase [Stakelama sediminis]MBB5718123.1 prolyl oligopeptidase [Stakelama sediminis]